MLNILVTDTNHVQATRGKRAIPRHICVNAGFMYWPVNFDHQARRVTVEVHDEAVDDLLATKAQPT